MRTGTHAVFDGREYEAKFQKFSDTVWLEAPGDEPPPEGFTRSRSGDGLWVRKVPRASVERLFEARTWGLYQGVFPVHVAMVLPEDRVFVEYLPPGRGYPYGDDHRVPKGADGYLKEPDGFFLSERGGPVVGTVPIAELEDVRTEIVELPIDPGPRPPWR